MPLTDIFNWRRILDDQLALIKANVGKIAQTDAMLREASSVNQKLMSLKDSQVQAQARVNQIEIERLQVRNPAIEAQAMGLASQMATLKAALEKNPIYANIQSTGLNMSILGPKTISSITNMTQQLTGFINASRGAVRDIVEHLKAVERVRAQVNSTADLAAGRGFAGAQKLALGAFSALPDALSSFKWIAIAGVAAFALWNVAPALRAGSKRLARSVS